MDYYDLSFKNSVHFFEILCNVFVLLTLMNDKERMRWKMVKFREAGYCNLKLLLIYLVIYGHWIEPQIDVSQKIYMQYWWIYLLHMPLFAFLSGLFLQSRGDCLQQVKKMLPLYLILQLIIAIVSHGNISIIEPFWHLWYLLSNSIWAASAWFLLPLCEKEDRMWKWVNMLLVLLTAVLIGAAVGHVPFLDRTLSGSRTIVFFPFFWLGLVCRKEFPWQKYRVCGAAALVLAIILAVIWGEQIPADFLYHAEPFHDVSSGFWMRLLCYGMSGLLGFFVLTWIPDRRYYFTKAGADTMFAYLFHAPIVGILREINMPASVSCLISGLLLYIIYEGTKWYSPLYGVYLRGEKRRDRRWLGFEKRMSNTEKQCIGSS